MSNPAHELVEYQNHNVSTELGTDINEFKSQRDTEIDDNKSNEQQFEDNIGDIDNNPLLVSPKPLGFKDILDGQEKLEKGQEKIKNNLTKQIWELKMNNAEEQQDTRRYRLGGLICGLIAMLLLVVIIEYRKNEVIVNIIAWCLVSIQILIFILNVSWLLLARKKLKKTMDTCILPCRIFQNDLNGLLKKVKNLMIVQGSSTLSLCSVCFGVIYDRTQKTNDTSSSELAFILFTVVLLIIGVWCGRTQSKIKNCLEDTLKELKIEIEAKDDDVEIDTSKYTHAIELVM